MREPVRIAIVVSLLAGAFAAARQAPPAPPPGTSDLSGIESNFKVPTNLSPAEMLVKGREAMDRMREGQKRVGVLQEQARKQGDIIKLNCVNDKLAQIRVLLKLAEQSQADLQEAIDHNDTGARNHTFTKISITSEKVQDLIAEAERCVGEDLTFIGDTQTDLDIDPNIPEGDPTQPIPTDPSTDRPPEASPFI